MKRLLLLGALAAAILVPAATAAAAATGTLRGTVVAKDRARHALVVARPGGAVQMLIAPKAFARTRIGRTVVARYSMAAGQLPVALSVSVKGHAHKARVRGTGVRLVKRQAVINAGGSLLRVSLKARSAKRTVASAKSGPAVGDTVEVEVEIDDGGTLGAGDVVMTGTPTGGPGAVGGEMEVHGVVAALTPASDTVPGSITVTVSALPVTCAIPVGTTLAVTIGDLIELKCDLIGDPAAWTVHVAKGEDEQGGESGGGAGDTSGPAHGDSSEVEVQGTVAASFLQTSDTITVTPSGGGADVTCTIVAGSLPSFAAGDSVKMQCVTVGDTLKLKEIEKNDDDPGRGGDTGDDGDHTGGGGSGGGED